MTSIIEYKEPFNLGWWEEFKNMFTGGNKKEEMNSFYDSLGKLFDQVMICRRSLLKAMDLGIASASDIAEFNSLAESYNNLVRQTALKYKEYGISFGGEFTFIKTTTMTNFRTTCCWRRKYSMQSSTGLVTDLAGFGNQAYYSQGVYGLGNQAYYSQGVCGFGEITDKINWKIVVTAGLVMAPLGLAGFIVAAVGSAIAHLFIETSSKSVAFKEKMMDKIAQSTEQKLVSGEWTPEQAFQYYTGTEAQFNATLDRLGLERPEDKGILANISDILGKTTTLLVVGGVVIGGIVIYNAIKHRRTIAKVATAAALKSPMPLMTGLSGTRRKKRSKKSKRRSKRR